MLQQLVWGFITGYVYATIAFLILCFFFRPLRNRACSFRDIANGLLLPLLAINFFFWIKDTAPAFFTAPAGDTSWHVRSMYSYVYLLSVPVLGFLFQLIFLKKSFRQKKWTTIVSVMLLLLLLWLDRIVLFIGSYDHTGYMQTSWRYAETTVWEQLYTPVMAIVYFLLCFLLSRPGGRPGKVTAT